MLSAFDGSLFGFKEIRITDWPRVKLLNCFSPMACLKRVSDKETKVTALENTVLNMDWFPLCLVK